MRLEIATYKAQKYAIMNFHYSKTMPSQGCSFSVFNDKGEWCGVISYSKGATNKIGYPYGLVLGQVVELVRVALNGKQESTSKAVSLSIKLLKKLNPLVKLIVSYADTGQGHTGTLYQATNWYYTGVSVAKNPSYIHKTTGRKHHSRHVSISGYSSGKKCVKLSECRVVPGTDKHKYIYPLSKDMVPMCQKLAKPYPKKEQYAEVA